MYTVDTGIDLATGAFLSSWFDTAAFRPQGPKPILVVRNFQRGYGAADGLNGREVAALPAGVDSDTGVYSGPTRRLPSYAESPDGRSSIVRNNGTLLGESAAAC